MNKLLVANRGEIAARVMRTARAMDVGTVAVFSDPDADAPYVEAADEAVHLPGATPAETYLRADLIVQAALATGADAVHPGYGFLAENAEFARACAEAGLVFVGPSPEAIGAMGSKIRAKELMARASVPVLPSTVIEAGESADPERLLRDADAIGYPVLIKAAFGGGGRGMRIARGADELVDAVEGARREAASAFGDGTVFLERYVENPRHVEVQIFGDTAGTVVHLFERECSIQRRYQKIVEEAPSPAVDDELRGQLGVAAVAAGKAIGYTGAGTVEFVLDPSGEFFFLEVNTRLQVEHPVTEMITGLDLVRAQLLVAEGAALPDEVLEASITGHAVEARLYAEDPAEGFLPASGTLARFRIPELPGVRVDSGVVDGSVVGINYDPMLAKVIAHGPTRAEACRRLARALDEAQLHGLATNRELLVGILREEEFRAGRTDTGYLNRHDPADLVAAASSDGVTASRAHALAAALVDQAARRRTAKVLATIPSGWRNVRSEDQHAEFRLGGAGTELQVRYRLADGGAVIASVHGTEREPAFESVRVRTVRPDLVDIEIDGVRRTVRVHRVGDVAYVDSALGATTLHEIPRFPDPDAAAQPGSLLAPLPGTVVRVAAEVGAAVPHGAPVVVIEAMKMEHTITAPHDGTVVELPAEVGQTVDTGAVLAVVEEQE